MVRMVKYTEQMKVNMVKQALKGRNKKIIKWDFELKQFMFIKKYSFGMWRKQQNFCRATY